MHILDRYVPALSPIDVVFFSEGNLDFQKAFLLPGTELMAKVPYWDADFSLLQTRCAF